MKTIVKIVIFLFFIFSNASAIERYVPTQYSTIQNAIDAAVKGDTIVVAIGTYYENINFKGKDITLTSTNPQDSNIVASTVINGSNKGTVVTFDGTETANCLLTGFTITGGHASFLGGGIRGHGTNVTITHCVIIKNISDNEAGGVNYCQGVISNCIISYNYAKNYSGGLGRFDGTVINCLICYNASANGGGISGCGNIINCTIVSNTASIAGGGLFDNYGGGVINCIVWNNYPDSIYIAPRGPVNYSCIQGGWPGTGNINADPCFINGNDPDTSLRDYQLKPDSPCINMGAPNYVPEPNETDLNGNSRIIGARIDMGAYEYQNKPPVANAGADQIVYAWIDGFADVNLDGAASFDEDGDDISYHWCWSIEEKNFDANGINPTIQLPVGEHKITLIVRDFLYESEPNDVNIIIIAPMEAQMRIEPRTINLKSKMPRIIVMMWLPEGVKADDVNSNYRLMLYPDWPQKVNPIEAFYQNIYQYKVRRFERTGILALFEKPDLASGIREGRDVEFKAVGKLTTGRNFFGSDSIKIIAAPGRK